jgi:hypothetical protein
MPSTCIRGTARLVARELLREGRPEKEGEASLGLTSRRSKLTRESQAYKLQSAARIKINLINKTQPHAVHARGDSSSSCAP